MIDIGILGAFLGGLLALLSPCAALLLPAFFAYAFDGLGRLVARTGWFLLGLLAVLVPLGAGVGAMGAAITRHRETTTLVAGLVLIGLGLVIASGIGLGSSRLTGLARRVDPASTLSVVALGAVYGLAGFCSGPLLGAVLTIAVAGGSAGYGGLLMACYAVGMTVPLLVLAAGWERLGLSRARWLRPVPWRIGPLHTSSTSVISGLLFVAIGLLFLLTSGTASLGSPVPVGTAAAWQARLAQWAAPVTDLTVLLVVAIAVAVGLAARIAWSYRPKPVAPVSGPPAGPRSTAANTTENSSPDDPAPETDPRSRG